MGKLLLPRKLAMIGAECIMSWLELVFLLIQEIVTTVFATDATWETFSHGMSSMKITTPTTQGSMELS